MGRQGFKSGAIHGDMEQPAREATLKRFRQAQINILVATDVASRGLDIPSVTHVINHDLPENFDDFVHRVGRTGRVGRKGWATSLYCTGGNYANTKILGGILGLLEGSGQPVPEFLQREAMKYGVSAANPNKGGKRRFGGLDARGGKSWSTTVGAAGLKRPG